MSLETETVLDRRRLKRSASLWRALAIFGLAVAIGFWAFSGEDGLSLSGSKHIARVTISGMITEDRDQLKMLKKLADSDRVAGVILSINSPGGTTSGGEALYDALRDIANKKPVAAQFGTVAASAAYIAGLGTDYIVARGNTITGSVGVIMQWPEVSELLGKLGIKMNEIKSGPLKATPSPFQPLDEAGRRVTEDMIRESQGWFLDLVRTRRQVDTAAIPGLEQGRVYSGREALRHKLVDEIGGEADAVEWMQEKRKVPKGLKIIDWKPRRGSDWPVISAIFGGAGRTMGDAARGAVVELIDEAGLGGMRLDGLVSVWQPRKN